MRQISKLKQRLEPWLEIKASLTELTELSELNDKDLDKEINYQVLALNEKH